VLHPGQQGVHLAAQSGLVRAAASDLAVAAQPAAVAAADTDPQTGTVKSEQPVAAAADSDSQAKVVRTNSDATSKAVHARRQWFVQIGAFARETNAQNVRAKVDATGLPSAAEASATPAGRLIRVRAGPFDSKGDAEKAALQIKALELPAVLVRQ
jgi:DedD protein